MKISHYLRLLVYDQTGLFGSAWILGVVPAFLGISYIGGDGALNPALALCVWFVIGLLAMGTRNILSTPITGSPGMDASSATANDLEFLFTRAIYRHSLYYARASRLLQICMLPFAVMLASGFSNPVARVDIPYDAYDAARQGEVEQFNLSHFQGSHLLHSLGGQAHGGTRVIIPYGRLDVALFYIAFTCFMTLLCQFIYTFVWGKQWAGSLVYLTALFLAGGAILLSTISTPPTWCDIGFAWMTLHPFLTLLVLASLGFVTLARSCRRYINMEITS